MRRSSGVELHDEDRIKDLAEEVATVVESAAGVEIDDWRISLVAAHFSYYAPMASRHLSSGSSGSGSQPDHSPSGDDRPVTQGTGRSEEPSPSKRRGGPRHTNRTVVTPDES